MAPMIPMDAASVAREADQERQQHDPEDAELTGRAEQDHLGVLEQRAEVRHRPDADEDQQREQLVRDARLVQDREQPVLGDHRRERQVGEDAAGADRQEEQRLVVLRRSRGTAAAGPRRA